MPAAFFFQRFVSPRSVFMAKAVRSKAVSSTSGKGKAPTPKTEAASATKAPASKKATAKAVPSTSKKAPPTAPKKSAPASAKISKAAASEPKSAAKKGAVPKGGGVSKKAAPAQKAAKASPAKSAQDSKDALAKVPLAKGEAGKTSVKAASKKAAVKAATTPTTAKKASSPKKGASPKPVSKVEKIPEEAAVLPVKDLGKPMEPYRARRVLITLPQPEGDKSPYFDFAKKQGLTIDFFPFISVEGLTGKEFRQQKIDFNLYTAVVFTSRLAVDHFFRIMEEVRIKVNQDLKYFCITEAVALYLQKFIMYRKRKVFFSADGSTQGLLDVIGKHKQERYLVSTADGVKKEIPAFLKKYKIVFAEAALYRTVANNISPAMAETRYDMILFFSPYSVQALFEQAPGYQQRDTVMGAFGPSTAQAVEEAGLRLDIKAPAPKMPSMVAALEHFFEGK
jgi:uroporphyrinogen-III synthase